MEVINLHMEVGQLKSKVERAIKTQELMKKANAAIKKAKGKDCTAELLQIGLDEREATKRQQKDFAGRIGYPAWELTNNNADIKRWSEKLALLERKLNAENSGGMPDVPFEGGNVVYNFSLDRLMLYYDNKPDEATRKNIKSFGFNWSPTEEAWVRQLTDAACYSASHLLGITVPKPGK